MSKHALGREQVRDAAWGRESYPHPLTSCMMPVVTLLAVLVLGMLGFSIWKKTLPESVNIPNVRGIPLEQAQKRLQDAGLAVEVIKDMRSSEKIPAGSVIASIPSEGRIVKEGRLVRLLLSAGSQYTKVPDVVNLPQGTAREMLAKARLLVTSESSKYDEKVQVDSIINIVPKPGTKVLKGSEVKLFISKGSQADLDLGLDGTDDMRSAALLINTPEDATGPAEIRIDVTDDNGTRTVFREMHNPGETFVQNVQGTGNTIAKVFYGDRLILTRSL